MNIDVIDMEDPVLGKDRQKQLDDRGVDSTKIIMYGMSNGVGQMITDISQRAAVGDVSVLRIWSHAGPGDQNISAGHGDENTSWAGISGDNINAMRDTLAGLNPYFAPGSRVELRGCNVAAGGKGEALLQALAGIWGVTVQGGIQTQYHIDWDGPVHQSDASGNLSCTAGESPS
jgi:Domain of unknown function (DUF4347)